MPDYMPSQDGKLITWEENLRGEIDNYSATLGLSAPDVLDIKTLCSGMGTAINANITAQNAAREAKKTKDKTVDDNKTALRGYAKIIKANKNYTAAIGAKLGLEAAEGADFDADNYKPQISAKTFPGHADIAFTKNGVEGVNIYARLKGQASWEKLGHDRHSPYVDNRPLAAAGVAEIREYMAIGVLDDVEVGQMSDIVQVVFGG